MYVRRCIRKVFFLISFHSILRGSCAAHTNAIRAVVVSQSSLYLYTQHMFTAMVFALPTTNDQKPHACIHTQHTYKPISSFVRLLAHSFVLYVRVNIQSYYFSLFHIVRCVVVVFVLFSFYLVCNLCVRRPQLINKLYTQHRPNTSNNISVQHTFTPH